ncbi:biotin synthase [Desulfacinum hydrothermale DSM 13146]|uniref:Biotin synthase n=1 Tax=Desulfacinum hydrothermale DSM 13146 TaxID=1121390 RepID=A0A1W1XIN5_9BACT|nr:biotin synthase BioB [Desulfacinum hydrothermale]SMC23682.1 biotin synthase [Desulfacinum hydrothermale DSM 13146]
MGWIEVLERRVLDGQEVNAEEALNLMAIDGPAVYDLLAAANRIARSFKGCRVELCGIMNAKSGRCPEDCAFCAQSVHHRTQAPVYGLKEVQEMVDAAREATALSATHFGIVTSGTGIGEGTELERLCEAVHRIATEGCVSPCASLGIVSDSVLRRLWDAGLRRYHHNLETARSYFPRICTTHDYDDDVRTVQRAKAMGFQVCSGGIFGIGECPEQRVELALTLRGLAVDAVPINFLVPVPGTSLEAMDPLAPLECLKIVAVYRFLLPRATLRVCAGRERNLRDLASWIFFAGADAMMVGPYLTTAGRGPDLDLQMVRDLGLQVVNEAEGRVASQSQESVCHVRL